MKQLIILLLCCCAFRLMGQGSISLEENMKLADIVIEGKVVDRTTFIQENQIFTKNEIEIYKQFKGSYAGKYISIVTKGGKYGDRESVCEDCLHLGEHQSGIFFANETFFGQNQYYVISVGNEGFYYYFTHKNQQGVTNGYDVYKDNLVLFKKLEQIVGHPKQIVALTREEIAVKKWLSTQSQQMRDADYCVQYDFKNLQVRYINFNVVVEVDIYAKALTDAFQLTKSKLAFEYATSIFGNNIAANQILTVTKGNAVQQPNYQLSIGDITNDKFYVAIESDIANPAVLETIGNNLEQLFHLKLEVANINPTATLFFNPEQIHSESKYYDNGQNLFFECYRSLQPFSGTLESLLTPTNITLVPEIITSGKGDLLEIQGDNFGNTMGTVYFEFLTKSSFTLQL